MSVRLAEGESLGRRFRLKRRLGDPAAAELWHAEDLRLGEPAVVRVIERKAAAGALPAAANGAGTLAHPALLRAYHHEQIDETHQAIVSESRSGLAEVEWHPGHGFEQLQRLLPAVDALDYLHRLGMAHGGIDRSTLLAAADGDCYLGEFGGARLAGTTATPAGDLHDLGRVLYSAVTGSEWREGTPANRLRELQLPAALARLIERLLSPAPYDRPASAREVAHTIRDLHEREGGRFQALPPFARAAADMAPDAAADAGPRRLDKPISPRESRVMSLPAAGGLFLLLALLLAGVTVVLPGRFEQLPAREAHFDQLPTPAPRANSAESGGAEDAGPPPGPAPFEQAMSEHLREEADALATELLRQQVYLEDTGVLLWSPERFEEARLAGASGDTLFREQRYEEALAAFGTGIAMLEELQLMIPAVLADALARAATALDDGQRDQAVAALEVALAIAPEEPTAMRAMRRAETLDQVFSLQRQAEAEESAGQFAAALANYRKALALDPAHERAREAIERVGRKVVERDFQQAMTQGLDALAAADYATASAAFAGAATLDPDAIGPRDGLEQVEIALRLREIEGHRAAAEALERTGEWRAAANEYAAALALDAGLVFASEGKARADERAEVTELLTRYLDDPELLTEESNYTLAVALANRAGALKPATVNLSRQVAELNELIRLAREPVEVEIRSDKLTEVSVYRVANLGRIESTRLTLYPGRYRALGQRRGYRDQLVEFSIVPGREPAVVLVRCTEKI